MEKVDKKIKNKNFIIKLMEIGKIRAEKSKDDKINKSIKKRANY